MAAVDDLAAGEPGGDEGISGGCAAELESEVVHLVEEFGDFSGFREESGGKGATLADGVDWGGDDFLVVFGFLEEPSDGGGTDAVFCSSRGGRAGGDESGIGGEKSGLFEEDFISDATPAADGEVVFSGGGEVAGVLAIGDEGTAESVGCVFELFFLAALFGSVPCNGGCLASGEFYEFAGFAPGSGDFFCEDERSFAIPNWRVGRIGEDGDPGAKGIDAVVNDVVHAIQVLYQLVRRSATIPFSKVGCNT